MSLRYISKDIRSDSSEQKTRDTVTLIVALISIEHACQDMGADEVGVALNSCQRLSSDRPEVLQLISALTTKLKSSQEPLSTTSVCIALFGLKTNSVVIILKCRICFAH